MSATKTKPTDGDGDQVYQRAISLLEKELGWTKSEAHEAIAALAARYGVFLDDVARAMLAAPTVKDGPGYALSQVAPDRRPLELRKKNLTSTSR